jgi:hypothetical protein
LIDLQAQEGPVEHGRRKIREVEIDEEASFLCSKCSTNPKCMVCHQNKVPGDPKEKKVKTNGDISSTVNPKKDVNGEGETGPSGPQTVKDDIEEEEKLEEEDDGPLRFRCFRCKQEAHYEHCKLQLSVDC